jgi:uncharacterized protein
MRWENSVRRTVLLGLLVIILSSDRSQAANPSFDCSKAKAPDEQAICSDDRLAELDRLVTEGFRQAKQQDKEGAIDIARDTLSGRQACGAEKLCILDQQVEAIGGFIDLGATVKVPDWVGAYRLVLFQGHQPVKGLPVTVGQCTFTEITSITDRFGEALKPPSNDSFDSGTAVAFANGGGLVSYDYEPDVAQSRVGDQVLLCLVSIPTGCPPGDDRGKFYSATNVRTKGSWLLPDSQHMCGGA